MTEDENQFFILWEHQEDQSFCCFHHSFLVLETKTTLLGWCDLLHLLRLTTTRYLYIVACVSRRLDWVTNEVPRSCYITNCILAIHRFFVCVKGTFCWSIVVCGMSPAACFIEKCMHEHEARTANKMCTIGCKLVFMLSDLHFLLCAES